jgi:hypothetical protein
MRARRPLTLLAAGALTLGAAACGGAGDERTAQPVTETSPAAVTTTTTADATTTTTATTTTAATATTATTATTPIDPGPSGGSEAPETSTEDTGGAQAGDGSTIATPPEATGGSASP